MEKRVLLAVVLSFLVLTAYRAFLPAPVKQSATAAAGTSAPASASPSTAPGSPSGAATSNATADQSTAPAPVPVAATTVADGAEREIVVTTNLVKAVFSNRGGVLKHWTLLHYVDHEGKPADLIPAGLPPTLPRPFSLRLADPERTAVVNTALYRTSS